METRPCGLHQSLALSLCLHLSGYCIKPVSNFEMDREHPADLRVPLHIVPQGIQFLIENDLLQSSPEDVAQFLYKGEGLNKTVIGDYLGER